MLPRVSKVKKPLVSLDISQLNVLVIFAVKTSTILEISKELLNDIFAECDRSSPIKNFTDSLNLGELEVDDISAKCTAGSAKKYIPIR